MGFTVSVMKSGRAMTRQLETPLNVHGNHGNLTVSNEFSKEKLTIITFQQSFQDTTVQLEKVGPRLPN